MQSRVETLFAYAVNIFFTGAMKQTPNAFYTHFIHYPTFVEQKSLVKVEILDALHRLQSCVAHRLLKKFDHIPIFQRWTRVGLTHGLGRVGLGWVGLGPIFDNMGGLGWVGLGWVE
jgi:hypothetical protein